LRLLACQLPAAGRFGGSSVGGDPVAGGDGMSDEPKESTAHLNHWLIAAVFVLVVYPLSVGPIAFIAGITTGRRPRGLVFDVLYTPLELTARAVPAIGRPLESYFDACYEEGRSFHRH
jgi:hypothetical protein